MTRFNSKTQLNRELLEQLYGLDHLSIEEIANRIGCGATTVARALHEYGIPTRTKRDYRLGIERAELEHWYVEKGYTEDRIGQLFGTSGRTIGRRLQELGIVRRSVGPVAQNTVPPALLSGWSVSLAYAVGLIASDGCLTQGNYEVEFVSSEDELIRLYLSLLHLETAPVATARFPGRRPWHRVRLSDRRYRAFLEGIGLTPAKSKTIGPLDIPDDVFVDFVRGLLDGDGSWYVSRSWQGRYSYLKVELCSASERFLRWVDKRILALTGLEGNFRSRSSGRSYDLNYMGQQALALGRWLYYSPHVPALRRKRQVWEQMQSIADSRRSNGNSKL